MPDARKRPCSICHCWFRPDPRVGARQRTCGQPECGSARRRKVQAKWRKRNPDYFAARRILTRGALADPPEPLRLPPPLGRLPWDIAQSEFGVKGADFIGVMGTLIMQAAQFEIKAYLTDYKTDAGTLLPSAVQSEIRLRSD
jgi:hypothetical protein